MDRRPAPPADPPADPPAGDSLDEVRARLDAIDRQVISLLAERSALVRTLIAWKEAQALPPRDPERESAMIRARRAWAEELGLSTWVAEAVTRAVLVGARGVVEEDRVFVRASK